MNGEYMDLYDENKNLTGKKIFREKGKRLVAPSDTYFIIVIAIIVNSENKILIQKTSKEKGSIYALPGGHVKSGQTSLDAIYDELSEEMNYTPDNIKLFKSYKWDDAFQDVYIINEDVDITKLKYQEDEVDNALFLSYEEIDKLIKKDLFRKTNIEALEDYRKKDI